MNPSSLLPYSEHMVPCSNARIYVRHYAGTGPAFVLMHGFPDNLHIYDRLIPALHGRQIIAFDFDKSDDWEPGSGPMASDVAGESIWQKGTGAGVPLADDLAAVCRNTQHIPTAHWPDQGSACDAPGKYATSPRTQGV